MGRDRSRDTGMDMGRSRGRGTSRDGGTSRDTHKMTGTSKDTRRHKGMDSCRQLRVPSRLFGFPECGEACGKTDRIS